MLQMETLGMVAVQARVHGRAGRSRDRHLQRDCSR